MLRLFTVMDALLRPLVTPGGFEPPTLRAEI